MEELPKIGKNTEFDKLTQHFFLYILHLKQAFDRNINQCMDKAIVQAWINKLMEIPHPNHFKAVKRNTYLAQLIINLYDGKLRAPFTRMPSNIPLEETLIDELPFCDESGTLLEHNVAPEVHNIELPLDELNHISSDGRTYIAIHSLENSCTVFGYVAVTIGHIGAGPLWMNSQGETIKSPIPNFQDLPVNSSLPEDSQGIEFDLIDHQASNGLDILVKEIWDVLSGRYSPDIRERARGFYRTLCSTINQEIVNEQNNLHSNKCRDPFINRLIFFLMKDLMAEGVHDPEAFDRFNQLSALKKLIKTTINEIETRQQVFEEVKKKIAMPSMQLFLHPSINNSSSFVSETVLREVLKTDPTLTDFLFPQYPSCVVKKFKMMIVNEKKHIMQLIKMRLDNVTDEMYKDLRESIGRGLRNYQVARNEWRRVWRVIREYNEVIKLEEKLALAVNYEKINDKFLDIIINEIDIAKIRSKNAKEKTKKLKKEIDLLNNKIREQNEINESETILADRQKKILIDEITNENIEIQLRIATIDHLEDIIR